MPNKREARQRHGHIFLMQTECLRVIEYMNAGMFSQMTVGNCRAFVIAGNQIYRDSPVGRLSERLECHIDQPRRYPGKQVAGFYGRTVSIVGVHRFKRQV